MRALAAGTTDRETAECSSWLKITTSWPIARYSGKQSRRHQDKLRPPASGPNLLQTRRGRSRPSEPGNARARFSPLTALYRRQSRRAYPRDDFPERPLVTARNWL